MYKNFIVTNFAYGHSPFLRVAELARAFNDELEISGHSRLGIIVPLVYGEKQKKIMAEEGLLSDEIILDAELGGILNKAFYAGGDFIKYLDDWTLSAEAISSEANSYIKKRYGKSVVVELSRSPRISYGIAPGYFTSFVYFSEILEKRGLPESAIKRAAEIESNKRIYAIAFPGTFSWKNNYKLRRKNEILAPPIGPVPKSSAEKIEPGIFVAKTGIPGLEHLYLNAEKFGLKVYDSGNYPHNLAANKNIMFHFTRSGWSSIWFSLLAEVPLVVPAFHQNDDPEIHFNNLCVEKLGIGVVYRGQKVDEILNETEKIKERCRHLKAQILERWGTLDGNRYCAKIFAKDFLRETS